MVFTQLNSDMMNKIGVLNRTAIDTLDVSQNVKGMYQDDSGRQYVFMQIASNYYSVQIVILNTDDTKIDRIAFRTALYNSTFAGKDFAWLKTATT